MEIKNYLEEIVIRIANDLIDKDKDFCKCNKCRLDVITYSLNRLRPKYASSLTGHALTAVDIESDQVQAKVTVRILRAIEQVKEHPNH